MKSERRLRFWGFLYLFLFLAVLIGGFVGLGHCQVQVAIAPSAFPQFINGSGQVLAGGFLYTYQAGTTTLSNTYVDSTGTTQNLDPIPLDATGAPSNGSTQTGIWLANQSYKFCLYNSSMVLQGCKDNLSGYLGLLNLANTWSLQQTFTLPMILSATDNQIVLGAPGVTTTLDFPPPASNIFLAFPSVSTTIAGRSNVETLTNKTLSAPIINNGIINTPSINWLKATNTVVETGDTSLHTVYSIQIPAGAMGPNNQLRVTLTALVSNSTNTPQVTIKYGSGQISTPVAISASTTGNVSWVILGGNLGVTNSQSWDVLEFPALLHVAYGNGNHQTTAIDSTVLQNITVTYQGGANTDSMTFYKCIVEIL